MLVDQRDPLKTKAQPGFTKNLFIQGLRSSFQIMTAVCLNQKLLQAQKKGGSRHKTSMIMCI
jgi:hypothetical protein